MKQLTHKINTKSKKKGFSVNKQIIIDLYNEIINETESFILYEAEE